MDLDTKVVKRESKKRKAAAVAEPYVMSPAQEVAVTKQVHALRRYGRSPNASTGGAGKTIMTPEAVRRYFDQKPARMIVVGLSETSDMEAKFREACERQGVELVAYVSWDLLRGKTCTETLETGGDEREIGLRHPYLRRFDRVDLAGKRHTRFEVTETWQAEIERGVALVADESSRFKNHSLQSYAFATLVTPIFADERHSEMRPGKGDSVVINLSATQLNKGEQAENVLRCIGLIKGRSACFDYDRSTGEVTPLKPTRKLFAVCEALDASRFRWLVSATIENEDGWVRIDEETDRLVRRGGVAKRFTPKERAEMLLYELYVGVLQEHLEVSIVQPFNPYPDKLHLDYRNVIYPVPKCDEEAYTKAVERLEAAQGDERLCATLREQLDAFKESMFSTRALDVLRTVPQSKVLIILNRVGTIEYVADDLRKVGYRVDVVRGGVSGKLRKRAYDDFQKPTDELRVIVAHRTTICRAISLHDPTGQWPRFTLASPSGFVEDDCQGMYRTKRHDVQGTVTHEFMFGGTGEGPTKQESKARSEVQLMLNTWAQVKKIKSVAQQAVKDGVLFPSDLPVYRKQPDGTLVLQESIQTIVPQADEQVASIATTTISVRRVEAPSQQLLAPASGEYRRPMMPWSLTRVQAGGVVCPAVVKRVLLDGHAMLLYRSGDGRVHLVPRTPRRVNELNEVKAGDLAREPEVWAWARRGTGLLGAGTEPNFVHVVRQQELYKVGECVWVRTPNGERRRGIVVKSDKVAPRVALDDDTMLLRVPEVRATATELHDDAAAWMRLRQKVQKKPDGPVWFGPGAKEGAPWAFLQMRWPQVLPAEREAVRREHGEVEDAPLEIDGRTYPTVAHYLYAMRWPPGSSTHDLVRHTSSLNDVQRSVSLLTITHPSPPVTPHERRHALHKALRVQFARPVAGRALQATDARALHFTTLEPPLASSLHLDSLPWTASPNAKDQDWLGLALRDIRDELHTLSNESPPTKRIKSDNPDGECEY